TSEESVLPFLFHKQKIPARSFPGTIWPVPAPNGLSLSCILPAELSFLSDTLLSAGSQRLLSHEPPTSPVLSHNDRAVLLPALSSLIHDTYRLERSGAWYILQRKDFLPSSDLP